MRIFTLLLLFLSLPVLATHNRAGEIIVRAAGDCGNVNDQLRACATIITYTETIQTEVDRDSLLISWGDGTTELIGRTLEMDLGNGIKMNRYERCHRYSGFGRYFISFQDQNRVAQVLNIDNGSSVNIPFSVYTVYSLVNPLLNGCNSTPEMTQIPIENACIGSVWTHNPGAFDVDGDSLAFEFTIPQRAPRAPIVNYILPNLFGGNTGSLFIDERTGQITWDAPAIAGEYNLAFLIKSFRNGIPLDTVVRDMQIFVEECNNLPPELDIPIEEICVVAGEIIEFDVVATAPLEDAEQLVRLQASGRPFDIESSPATFTPQQSIFLTDPVTKTFRWETNCSHISNQPYFVVFRAEDDFFERFNIGNREGGLATLRAVSIKVVAPPPTGLMTAADDASITLTWDKPYACEDEPTPRFLGFTVWRRDGSNPFVVDTCETGLAGRGYTLLTPTETTEMEDGRYVFIDDDIERGRTYCYRVVALLGRPIANVGLIFEEIESIPSEEICVQLARDIPLLTKVDVTATDPNAGSIDVCWLLPEANALDTILNTGPYRYVLSRAEGQTTEAGAFQPIATFTRSFFGEAVDTCFTDTGLNTTGLAYTYRIELFVENESEPIGEAQPATSVRLGAAPTDRAAVLNWTAITPWTNFSFDVFRRDPGSADYARVATVTEPTYRDEGLENGETYCYYILAAGSYNIDEIPSPLLNRSQELCLVPIDNVPPCPPQLSVLSVCDRGVDCTVPDNLFNTLNWVPPLEVCGSPDVAGYTVYFAATPGAAPVRVGTTEAGVLTFEHTPPDGITGCYYVTATDGSGNESALSNEICVTNCPIYELPNTFTPNADGRNDNFVPRGRCFVERVEFRIFNRWGQLVFETEDPAINWNGQNLNGELLSSGTYYYVGQVFEQRLEGVTPAAEPISGYIELIRGE
ncbi:gliding motility-associated C-terminal domain-containing protein [Neolewinella lacunae]|uniref:Gliding motility-associated C-terminal domain-containing protein n=1 Tax=Neolewinella lacunae TaxID=1517758 RepID=A0A923PL12_9BACT|nr:gliding motility-associated C-terminal domain-containing protein [Neolewinella lacunae]MBC6993153.1 gliding motility-associated C-terminal domain-containing protein [Neolewinella lacunae]MDN3635124.1 gliding motility-associated C-terminal domain-containing protein [Neolewinella lacunae]